MLDLQFLNAPRYADVQIFTGDRPDSSVGTWLKPRGVGFVHFIVIGPGGNGAAGGNSLAASSGGGGGGGSGGFVTCTLPGYMVPNVLSVVAAAGGSGAQSIVQERQSITNSEWRLMASAGGNASGSTGGTAGSNTVGSMIISSRLRPLTGHAGTGSGGAVDGTALTLPTSGLMLTGGTGGGGTFLGQGGKKGGDITGAGPLPTLPGGAASPTNISPGVNGSNGYQPIPGLLYFYGGTGGSASGTVSTGTADPVVSAGNGGDGSYGCGGGGGGAAGGQNNNIPGVGGRGGPGLVIIVAW